MKMKNCPVRLKTVDELKKDIEKTKIEIRRLKDEILESHHFNNNLELTSQIEYYAKFKCYCQGDRVAKKLKLFRTEEFINYKWNISSLSFNKIDELIQKSLKREVNMLEIRAFSIAKKEDVKEREKEEYSKETLKALCEKLIKEKEKLRQLEHLLITVK